MKRFLKKIALFFFVLMALFLIGILLPATPRAKTSLLFSKIQKDSLLVNIPSPRIILIGGSSISMSLNSQRIKDSLGLNPVNTGVHAAIGLIFMLDHTIKYIKQGDLVVVAPEYDQLFGDFAYGSNELLHTFLDTRTENISVLRWKQIVNINTFLPKYVLSKFKPFEYEKSADWNTSYIRNAFDKYGDCVKRNESMQENTLVFGPISEPINKDIFEELKDFERKVNARGAKMIVTFPAFQEASFNNIALEIKQVEQTYHGYGFKVIGTPEEYKFPNSLIYDTPYHLTTKGIEIRTQILIKELLYDAHLKRKQ